ncbi:MAG: branched-chain amino acid ABC transporter permease [Chloroflexi bacterium]|nr:branched-chain amino acid ABC transporter permease [Chloroflexota bacterium]
MSVNAPLPQTSGRRTRITRITRERNKLIAFAVLFVVAMLYPLVGRPIFALFDPNNKTLFGDITASLNTTLIFTLLAVGLNIVVGYAGLLDLGYAAFFAIGGYTMGFLTSQQSPLYDTPFHTNFWVALPISFLMAALFGVLLGAPTLGLKGDYLAIVTLGFGEIVPITFNTLNKITKGDSGLAGLIQPNLFGFQFTASTVEAWYWLAILVVALSIFLARRLIDSRVGRAWMAMREDEIAASAMGINLVRTKLLAFGLGASFAGFAGAIAANSQGSANPSQFRYDVSIFVLSMVIFGGIGNLWGVIAGSFILSLTDRLLIPFFTGLVKNYAEGIELTTQIDANGVRVTEPNIWKDILTNVGSDSRLFIFGLILVTMMLLCPEGLFGINWKKSVKQLLKLIRILGELVR